MPRPKNSAGAVLLLAAATACAQTAPSPDPAQLANLSGMVTNSATGAPLARVRLSFRSDNGMHRYGAVSNAEGKFSITGMVAGKYGISAARTGFLLAHVAFAPAPEVNLRPGARQENYPLKMTPGGAITGRVLDADGEPMPNVSITVLGANPSGGDWETDDRGQYRIGGLMPGRYRVVATPQSLPLEREIRSDGTEEVHYSRTFFPAALKLALAGKVEVAAGGETGGVDIRLVRTPMVRVSGTVSGFPKNAKFVRIRVQVQQNWQGGYSDSQVKPDGTFEVWRLDPGKYTIWAEWNGEGQALRTAPMEVDVAGSDVDHLVLAVQPPIDVTGKLDMEDQPAQPTAESPAGGGNPRRLQARNRLNLRPVEAGGRTYTTTIDAGGTFTFHDVAPARYRVAPGWGPSYVKSMHLGPTDMPNGILDLRNGGGDLSVVVSSAMGKVTGKVRDEGVGVAGLRVAAVPDTPDGAALARWATVAEDGGYSLDLPPGDYKLAAVEEMDVPLISQGIGLADYRDVSESVTVKAKESAQQDLGRRKQ